VLAGASVPGWDTSHVSLWPGCWAGSPVCDGLFFSLVFLRPLRVAWRDILCDKGRIAIRQTFVHLGIQDGAKTKLSPTRADASELLLDALSAWRTTKTRCRKLCFAPGGIATALTARGLLRKARRSVHGSTSWLRTPASKVCLWRGSQHRPKHFNEGTYTVVTDRDSDLRDRFPLCQHLKGGKQPRLLSPTAK
jgi:hypothetical protein